MDEITTYKKFISYAGFKDNLREVCRDAIIETLSITKNISKTNNCIRFPYYHNVFDDEKKGFRRQLKYLKQYGDFISMDEVVELMTNESPINGRYFCVGFDDGLYNCYSNMLDITYDLDIPVIIYLPTDYIGLDMNKKADINKANMFYPRSPGFTKFLSWEDCKHMLSKKVSFGSHTCGHINLLNATPNEILYELENSKKIIEEKLSIECVHFAAPWGKIGVNFNPNITTDIAQKLGYKSFVATNRGITKKGDNLFTLNRDHLLANWSNSQVKYFLGV